MAGNPRCDEGVSSVIGALLVLVALTTLLALLQATTVPGMNRDAEATHADKVVEEFFSLQEKVDEAGASGVARTAKITAGTLYPQVPFLYNPNPGTSGNVDLRQGQRVLARYAADTTAPFATTVPFTSASFPLGETAIASVSAFTMTLTDISSAGPPEITVASSGAYASTWSFDRGAGPGANDLIIDWGTNGGGCPDPQTIVGYFLAPAPVNILACETGLSNFVGTVDLAFTYTGPGNGVGSYTLAGTRGVAGGNVTPVNATAAFLNFTANYNYWSPTVLRYEHGAVVRTSGGVPFLTSPSAMLSATHNSTSNNTTVSVYIPRLNATNASVSQRVPLSVRLNPGPLSRSTATAYNLTLEVGTSNPTLWSAYFSTAMNASGLPTAGNWTVSAGADWARLVIDRGTPPRLNLTVSTATVEAAR